MKNKSGKFKRALATAAIGVGSVFSTGCDLENYLTIFDSLGDGNKLALVERHRATSEPPVSRRNLGPVTYQRRAPGITNQNLELWRGSNRLVNIHAPPYLPYFGFGGSTVLDAFYIRNPITDPMIERAYQDYLLRTGQPVPF